MHVHCIANYRVSVFFYRYRRDVLGMTTQTSAEMETIWHPEVVWAAFVELLPAHVDNADPSQPLYTRRRTLRSIGKSQLTSGGTQ